MSDPIHHRVLRLEQELEELKKTDEILGGTLSALEKSTDDIIGFFNAFKGAFKVLEMFAKFVRPIAYIFMFASAAIGVAATLKEVGVPW